MNDEQNVNDAAKLKLSQQHNKTTEAFGFGLKHMNYEHNKQTTGFRLSRRQVNKMA
jgi:hypothetical protein